MSSGAITVTFTIDPSSRLNHDTPVFLKTRDGEAIGELTVHRALTVTLPRSQPYFKCGMAFSLELFKLRNPSTSPQTVTLFWNGQYWLSKQAEHAGGRTPHRTHQEQESGERWTPFFFTLAALSAIGALIGAYNLFPEEGGRSLPLKMYLPSLFALLNGITVAIALFAVGELASRVHQLESQRSKR